MNRNTETFERFITKYRLCREGRYTWGHVDALIAQVKDVLQSLNIKPSSTRQGLLAQVEEELSKTV